MPAPPTTTAPTTAADQDLPPEVRSFQRVIQRMTPKQVADAAVERFGRPARERGSGISILEWDVAGGVLTASPHHGLPTFRTSAGRKVQLIATESRAGPNVSQSFEMVSRPDPANHDTTFWIGNVEIRPDGTYLFADANANLNDRGDQGGNFFVRHAAGHVTIEWVNGVTADTLLESASDREVARLTFAAGDDATA